jgi:hypothetical protein
VVTSHPPVDSVIKADRTEHPRTQKVELKRDVECQPRVDWQGPEATVIVAVSVTATVNGSVNGPVAVSGTAIVNGIAIVIVIVAVDGFDGSVWDA